MNKKLDPLKRQERTGKILRLTCNFQRGIATDGFSEVVSGHADVRPFVRFAASAMDYSQEEQGAAGQQHAVGARIVLVRLHPLSVLVPLHGGRGPPLGLAVEGGRLALGHDQVGGVLHDAGRGVLLPQTGSWKADTEQERNEACDSLGCFMSGS